MAETLLEKYGKQTSGMAQVLLLSKLEAGSSNTSTTK
jgi:hypothetical protein